MGIRVDGERSRRPPGTFGDLERENPHTGVCGMDCGAARPGRSWLLLRCLVPIDLAQQRHSGGVRDTGRDRDVEAQIEVESDGATAPLGNKLGHRAEVGWLRPSADRRGDVFDQPGADRVRVGEWVHEAPKGPRVLATGAPDVVLAVQPIKAGDAGLDRGTRDQRRGLGLPA